MIACSHTDIQDVPTLINLTLVECYRQHSLSHFRVRIQYSFLKVSAKIDEESANVYQRNAFKSIPVNTISFLLSCGMSVRNQFNVLNPLPKSFTFINYGFFMVLPSILFEPKRQHWEVMM